MQPIHATFIVVILVLAIALAFTIRGKRAIERELRDANARVDSPAETSQPTRM